MYTSSLIFQKNFLWEKCFWEIKGEIEYYNSALITYCLYMQNILRERFCGQIRGELNIIILHLWYSMQYVKNAES